MGMMKNYPDKPNSQKQPLSKKHKPIKPREHKKFELFDTKNKKKLYKPPKSTTPGPKQNHKPLPRQSQPKQQKNFPHPHVPIDWTKWA